MKCDKCGGDDYVIFCHDRENKEITGNFCDKCLNYPEYHTDCPHCDAQIAVN